MTDSIKLLDAYCKICMHESDSAAARALKVQPSAVNNWRHGRAKPNAESVERMCIAINEPLRKWLPLIEAERARTPADRKVWLRLAQAAAAVVLVVSFSRLDGQTTTAQGIGSFSQNPGAMYIMSIIILGMVLAVLGFQQRRRHAIQMDL